MADIEAKAEAEAEHKGLKGSARRAYIGGVWNRIKQAHAKATKPGGHAVPKKLMNRRARQQAREDARNAMRPHQEAIADIRKQREFRLGLHRDEPKATQPSEYTQGEYRAALARHDYEAAVRWGKHISPQAAADAQRMLDDSKRHKRQPKPPLTEAEKRERGLRNFPRVRDRQIRQAVAHGAPDFPPGVGQPKPKPAKRELTPVGRVDPASLDPYKPPNPHALRQLYGDEQLEAALSRYSLDALKKSAEAHGVDSKTSSKRVLVERLMAKARGKPAPPPPPAAPAAMARREEGGGDGG